ncbi:hypothetical protein FD13_GL001066 [Levilactobacillus senmaizukei DSM 21775 = NBRC 103853]|uniref:Uncharacterized protein n=1 Tax=Levilactobacillus senmaizukei DSM 21775 = NBRC 103853 TaxID=1423803 RepID=A0A0R2DMD1_9LACO|nr:hypothetical protein [Levilactobacillus senmaizukei]KRN01404.1 hypothetical protein FD13_GL001066 [Levilactobacillus senmaizukei DSM 21775 = NBRC 103853]
MRDRNVIAWAVVSLVGFLVINFLMTQSFVQGSAAQSGELMKSSLIAIGLYAVTIVLAALDWKPSFYLMGLVIALYTLGLIGVLVNMWNSHTNIEIRLLMSALSLALMAGNGYWLVLALRLRKRERDKRDRQRFSK